MLWYPKRSLLVLEFDDSAERRQKEEVRLFGDGGEVEIEGPGDG